MSGIRVDKVIGDYATIPYTTFALNAVTPDLDSHNRYPFVPILFPLYGQGQGQAALRTSVAVENAVSMAVQKGLQDPKIGAMLLKLNVAPGASQAASIITEMTQGVSFGRALENQIASTLDTFFPGLGQLFRTLINPSLNESARRARDYQEEMNRLASQLATSRKSMESVKLDMLSWAYNRTICKVGYDKTHFKAMPPVYSSIAQFHGQVMSWLGYYGFNESTWQFKRDPVYGVRIYEPWQGSLNISPLERVKDQRMLFLAIAAFAFVFSQGKIK